jgi:hypothetical protein
MGGKNEDADEVERRCCAGLFCKYQDGEEWVRRQRCLKWANTVWANHWKRAFCACVCVCVCVCVTSVRNDRRWFIMAAKCYEEIHFVVLINKTHCFWPP